MVLGMGGPEGDKSNGTTIKTQTRRDKVTEGLDRHWTAVHSGGPPWDLPWGSTVLGVMRKGAKGAYRVPYRA